jgi:hypothetical protein
MRYFTRFIVELEKNEFAEFIEKLPPVRYDLTVKEETLIFEHGDFIAEVKCRVLYPDSGERYSKIEIDYDLIEAIKKQQSKFLQIEGTKFGAYIFGDSNISLNDY